MNAETIALEEKVMKHIIWDFTRVDAFQRCRRYYYYMMIRHLRTKKKSAALTFGGAIHNALDTHYIEGIDKALVKFRETYVDVEGDSIRTVETGVRLLENYARVYAHEPFELLGKPETGFVFPLTDDILWGGRMDLPVLWSGDLWVMEHKTTTRLSSNYFNQFALCKQLTGYSIAAEAFYNRKCLGCIVNVLEPWKKLIRPTVKSKTPDQHFARNPMSRPQRLKDRFKLNIQRIVRDARWCEENGEFHEAERKEICFSYNSSCPYKDLCLYGEDERIIKRDFMIEEWKPYTTEEEKKESKNDKENGAGK